MGKNRPITTQPDDDLLKSNKMRIGGWFQNKHTYLWFGDEEDHCIGVLSGQKLYRLAKAIVKQFEGENNEHSTR